MYRPLLHLRHRYCQLMNGLKKYFQVLPSLSLLHPRDSSSHPGHWHLYKPSAPLGALCIPLCTSPSHFKGSRWEAWVKHTLAVSLPNLGRKAIYSIAQLPWPTVREKQQSAACSTRKQQQQEQEKENQNETKQTRKHVYMLIKIEDHSIEDEGSTHDNLPY